MTIAKLITKFNESSQWIVTAPAGVPSLSRNPIAPNGDIPNSVFQFYSLCGGLKSVIQYDEDIFLSIEPPQGFSWAVEKILGQSFQKQVDAYREHRSWFWYVIGRSNIDQYFVIDLAPERFGYCYYTELYFFAQKGRTPVIGTSFLDLLERFYEAVKVGEDWSWESSDYGDAFD